LKWCW